VAEYAPYSALFGQASMVVHQGGVGTTAQCLRAGKPMLIMPYSHDQPDNGRRVRRLKVGRVIQRKNYTPLRVEKRLRAMLDEPQFAKRAAQVAQMLANEDGVGAACDALEELEAGQRVSKSAS
jgi:UDP:flavonoid glycosyltransferase YjiC (YdhE family)